MANKTTIRQTHPNLYIGVMGFALMSVALGLNWIFASPTYLPYGLPVEAPGVVLLGLGVAKVVLLNILDGVTLLRWVMAMSIAFMFFLGLGYLIGFCQDDIGSLQPAIFYTFFGLIQMSGLMEPTINPLTMKTNGTT